MVRDVGRTHAKSRRYGSNQKKCLHRNQLVKIGVSGEGRNPAANGGRRRACACVLFVVCVGGVLRRDGAADGERDGAADGEYAASG